MVERKNVLREVFEGDAPTLGTHMFLPEPAGVEAIGQTGVFDYVEFLAEYNAFTLHDLDHFCRTAELMGLGSLIKLEWESNRYFAQRAVGSGFDGVLFADPRGADDVEHCVASVKPDHPDHRGTYGATARRNARPGYGGTPDYVRSVGRSMVGIMVEVPQILDDLESVLAVPGVDFIQWGPVDFAMRSGWTGDQRTRMLAEREAELIRLCDAEGIPYRIEVIRAEDMRRYADQGARHFSIGYDLGVLHHGFKSLGEDARDVLRSIT